MPVYIISELLFFEYNLLHVLIKHQVLPLDLWLIISGCC